MALVNFIIWNVDPEMFSFTFPFTTNTVTVRWYGVLFALGFILSQQLLHYIYRKESKPERDVDTLTIYMVIATLIGARLGHVLFYEPNLILENPLGIFLPFEFTPKFKFVGLQGLASHGGAIGILIAIWIYCRKRKLGQNFLQVADRIVILVALTGCLIRIGNFFNSEIIGIPTHSSYGVVFASNLTKIIKTSPEVIDVSFAKVKDSTANENGYMPAKMLIDFKTEPGMNLTPLKWTAENLLSYEGTRKHFDSSEKLTLPTLVENEMGGYSTITYLHLIPRYPTQLYEAFSCLLLFIALFIMWSRKKNNLLPGKLFAIFLIVCFGLRFLFEFIKEPQVPFEESMMINMGQWLSIPLIITGVIILFRLNQKKNTSIES